MSELEPEATDGDIAEQEAEPWESDDEDVVPDTERRVPIDAGEDD
jgi:hypothetical protein